jgi:hypothetical protein
LSKAEYKKKGKDAPPWEGPRAIEEVDLEGLGTESRVKIQIILDLMDCSKLIAFKYGESYRVVAPFVLGVSSEGNPLMRGYQVEGVSKSGKGAGWRVYQISKMENIEDYQDFFDADDFDFDGGYPWIYKIFKML